MVGSLRERRLVFTHIPKAAGTTLDYILGRIAGLRNEVRFRAKGTLYGQFLGQGKIEAAADLRNANPSDIASARFLVGHVPTTAWDDIPGAADAAFVTILRDPVDRMISHYRYGIARKGWESDASPADLTLAGQMVDNLQVRQISGCLDASEPCTDAMVDSALEILRERYAVVGFADKFDAILGALIALLGWPDVLYSAHQVGKIAIDDDRVGAIREECRDLNTFDERLVSAIRHHGDVWVNRVGFSEPPAADDAVIVVTPKFKDHGRVIPIFPKSALPEFKIKMRSEGVEIERV